MPVKNIRLPGNSVYYGMLVGLTEEEKNLINSAVSGGALIADTFDDMTALLEDKDLKEGQLCYCKETTTLYVLEGGAWVEAGGGTTAVLRKW